MKIRYRCRQTPHAIQIRNLSPKTAGAKTVARVTVDGVEGQDKFVPLVDDQHEHKIEVEVQ